MIFGAILIVISLAAAGIFRKYFIHIYRVGHENVIKSLAISFFGGAAIVFLIRTLSNMVPEGRTLFFVLAFLLPVVVTLFSTGCALIAGLTGLIDGGKHRFVAIILVGTASFIATEFFPIGGTFILGGVMAYGLGATILAFAYPIADEEVEPVRQSGVPGYGGPEGEAEELPQAEVQQRVGLGGDLSPISPRDEEERR